APRGHAAPEPVAPMSETTPTRRLRVRWGRVVAALVIVALFGGARWTSRSILTTEFRATWPKTAGGIAHFQAKGPNARPAPPVDPGIKDTTGLGQEGPAAMFMTEIWGNGLKDSKQADVYLVELSGTPIDSSGLTVDYAFFSPTEGRALSVCTDFQTHMA